MDEQTKKMQSIDTVEYYLAFKKEEMLQKAKAWVNFEDIVLSEKKPVTEGQILRDPLI